MAGLIVAPEIKLDERIYSEEELYKKWRAAHDEAHPAPPITNIRFIHDPNWRGNFLSIQTISESTNPLSANGHWAWRVAAGLFWMSQIAWIGGSMFVVFNGWL